jgi:hypothetical protein
MVFLSEPGDYLQAYGVGMDTYHAWHGDDLYPQRIVETDPMTGEYRVGSKDTYPCSGTSFPARPVHRPTPETPGLPPAAKCSAINPPVSVRLSITIWKTN